MRKAWSNFPVHELRTVFMVAPKCGNTAVKKAIQAKYGPPGKVHSIYERWSPGQVHASDYQRIAICRNPYARAVSCWWNKVQMGGKSGMARHGIRHGMSFEEFLKVAAMTRDGECDIHLSSQAHHMVFGARYLPHHTFRLEDPDMWNKVQALADLPNLEPHNVSNPPAWETLCHGEAARLIEARWGRDFEVFGYEMLRRR